MIRRVFSMLLDILLSLALLPYVILSMAASLLLRGRARGFVKLRNMGSPEALRVVSVDERFSEPDYADLFDHQIEFCLLAGRAGETVRMKQRTLIPLRVHSLLPAAGSLLLLQRMFRVLRAHGCSVLFADGAGLEGILGWALSVAAFRPFCLRISSDLDESFRIAGTVSPRARARLGIAHLLMRRANLVLVTVPGLREFALRNGVADARIREWAELVDPSLFDRAAVPSLRRRLGSESVFQISFIGRIQDEKCVMDLVEIASGCRRRNFDVHFHVVGTGTDEGRLRRMIEQNGHHASFTFHGWKDARDTARHMMASDLLILPIADRACIEGALSGTPVLYYGDHHGHQFLDDAVSGFRARRGNISFIIQVIQRVMGDPGLRKSVGQKARERALELFSPALLMKRRRDILAGVCVPATAPDTPAKRDFSTA